MEKSWNEFEEENRKLDERIAEIQSATLILCTNIVENRQRYSTRLVDYAAATKEQLTK